MAIPDPYEMPANGVIDSSAFNAGVRDALERLLNPPIFRARSNATQSINSGTYTSVDLAAEDVDSENAHSTVTAISRYVATEPGWVWVAGAVLFAGSVTGRRGVRVAVNGTVVNASKALLYSTGAAAVDVPMAGLPVYLDVGDYIELQALQESGGALNIGSATVDDNSHLSLVWVRKNA